MRSGLGKNPLWRAAAGVAGLLALATALAAGVLLLLGSADGRNGEQAAESDAGASRSVDGPPGRRSNPSVDRADETVGSGSKVSLPPSRDASGDEGQGPRSLQDQRSQAESPATDPTDESGLWPAGGYRTAAVRPGERVGIYADPGGKLVKRVGSKTEFGSPQVFSVLEREGDWIAVATPETQDNGPGWVRIDTEALTFGAVPHAIVAHLGEERIELHRRGQPVKSYPVTIGAAGTSTPAGRFAVTDVITRGLSPAYGCCAIALSARQPNLPPGWLGGDRVAIHGTSGPVGGAQSAGCLRTHDSVVMALMEDLPLGTPVTIRA